MALRERDNILLLYLKVIKGVIKRLLWAKDSWLSQAEKRHTGLSDLGNIIFKGHASGGKSKGSGMGADPDLYFENKLMGGPYIPYMDMYVCVYVCVYPCLMYFHNDIVLPI